MNNKNKRILDAIFKDPIPSNIKWAEIESLFRALDAIISEGSGSRVRIHLHHTIATFHRPHPKPDTNKATIKDIRDFLRKAGVKP